MWDSPNLNSLCWRAGKPLFQSAYFAIISAYSCFMPRKCQNNYARCLWYKICICKIADQHFVPGINRGLARTVCTWSGSSTCATAVFRHEINEHGVRTILQPSRAQRVQVSSACACNHPTRFSINLDYLHAPIDSDAYIGHTEDYMWNRTPLKSGDTLWAHNLVVVYTPLSTADLRCTWWRCIGRGGCTWRNGWISHRRWCTWRNGWIRHRRWCAWGIRRHLIAMTPSVHALQTWMKPARVTSASGRDTQQRQEVYLQDQRARVRYTCHWHRTRRSSNDCWPYISCSLRGRNILYVFVQHWPIDTNQSNTCNGMKHPVCQYTKLRTPLNTPRSGYSEQHLLVRVRARLAMEI